jgi:hypothetical protein
MAKKNKKPAANAPMLFNVVYQDGTLSSNRKVPSEIIEAWDGDAERDARVRAFIETQDREIAERSGRPRGPIKTIARASQ